MTDVRLHQENEAALREAASLGDTTTVTRLITGGHVKNVDAPNPAGWTALHLAAVGPDFCFSRML